MPTVADAIDELRSGETTFEKLAIPPMNISAETHSSDAADRFQVEQQELALVVDNGAVVGHYCNGCLGSATERTLRVSPIPVVTVHESTDVVSEFETILLPTDGSETATDAATHAIQLAAMTDATLHIVHVVDLTIAAGEYGSGAILNALEAAGQQAVDTVIERATEADIPSVEASVLSGAPSRAITDYATDRNVDLVVMGTHGRSGLDRFLIGSVTENVVRLAEMPVLSVLPRNET